MGKNFEWNLIADELLQHSSEPALVFDPLMIIVSVNELFLKIVEKPKSAFIGEPLHKFFPDLNSLEGNGKGETTGNKLGKGFGITYQVKINKIIPKKGDLSGGILTLTSLRPQVSEPLQEAFFSYLLGQVPHGLLVFDTSATILVANDLMQNYLSPVTGNGLTGEILFDLFPKPYRQDILIGIESVLQGKSHNLPKILLTNNHIKVNFQPLISCPNQVNGGVMVCQEVNANPEAELSQPNQNILPAAMQTVWITQIQERKRIASKIHNSLGQLLYGFKMEFNKKGQALPEETRNFFHQLLDDAIQETKLISFELMPAMLEDFGLEATLEELVNKNLNGSLKLSYHVNGLNQRLESDLEIIIFSVIQELVNNIIKHAKATKARIYLELGENTITIKVIDNGKGFKKGKIIYAMRSTGLRNIKNSLKIFNGHIKINSQIGKGTLITVQFPLERNPEKGIKEDKP